MGLVESGIKARITDNTPVDTSDITVLNTPHGDKPYVKIYYIPENNDHPEVDEYHDVIVRGPMTADTDYAHRRTDGPFDQNEAAEHAVDLATKYDIPLINRIHTLKEYNPDKDNGDTPDTDSPSQ